MQGFKGHNGFIILYQTVVALHHHMIRVCGL